MTEILKMLELAEHNSMAEVQVRRSGVHAEFHPQRFAGRAGFLQLRAQFALANYFGTTFFDIS